MPVEIDDATFRTLTTVMRLADREHEKSGGGTRHYLRDCFLPMLAEHGLTIAPTTAPLEGKESTDAR